MVMQNEKSVTFSLIAVIVGQRAARLQSLGDGQLLFSVVLVAFLCHHPLDAVEAFADLGKGRVERREAETQVIGFAEVGDDVHFFDEGTVDAVAFGVADGDV